MKIECPIDSCKWEIQYPNNPRSIFDGITIRNDFIQHLMSKHTLDQIFFYLFEFLRREAMK